MNTIDSSLPSWNLSLDDEYARNCLKIDYKKFAPHDLTTINTIGNNIEIYVPSQGAYMCLRDAYIKLKIDVMKANGADRYEDDDAVSLVNFGQVALFDEATLKTHKDKHLERVSNLYEGTLMYKLLSAEDTELGEYFTKDTNAGAINTKLRNRLINDNDSKGTLVTTIPLKDIFGFCAHQSKITYGLGFNVSLKRRSSDYAIFRTKADGAAGADVSRLIIRNISLYVPFYTLSLDNDAAITSYLTGDSRTSMSFIERSMNSLAITQNNEWTHTLGVKSGIDRPIYVIVGFKTTARRAEAQNQNGGVFDNCPVMSANVKVGTDRFPDDGINVDYTVGDYDEAYRFVKEFKSHYLSSPHQPFITYREFKSLYNIYVFDLRFQKEEMSAQPIELNFKFREDVAGNYTAYILTLKERKIFITADGQRQTDIL